MKITDELIIQSVRRKRQAQNSNMNVRPWHTPKNGLILRRLMLPAACIIGFVMGYGLRPMSESNTATLPQQTLIQRDTVMLTQTVRDTIYQTRIVTRQVPVQHLAVNTSAEEENTATSDETKSCSMLCDDIRYDMLAQSH